MPGTSTCCTSPEHKSFSGDTNSKRKFAIVHLNPVLAESEAHTQSDYAADHGHDRYMQRLLTGERSATRPFVVPDLDAQRPQLDLGRLLGARHVPARPPITSPISKNVIRLDRPCIFPRPPPPRVFCPSRPLLRWDRPCRRPPPGGYHTCLRRVP